MCVGVLQFFCGTLLFVFIVHEILILFEINELALYAIDKELTNINTHYSFKIYPILGSVNNKKRLKNLFKRFDVDTVYHSAAYKHVPMVEFNNTEGIDNNIFVDICHWDINPNDINYKLKNKLLKTGGFDKHSKHQEQIKTDKNLTTKDSLNYAKQEGTMR